MKQFLKKTKRFIMHYWLSISLGMIATPFAIQYAYQDRGRLAFGGEYLVLPAMVMGAYLLRQVVPAILEMIYELIYGEEEPEDDTSGSLINTLHAETQIVSISKCAAQPVITESPTRQRRTLLICVHISVICLESQPQR